MDMTKILCLLPTGTPAALSGALARYLSSAATPTVLEWPLSEAQLSGALARQDALLLLWPQRSGSAYTDTIRVWHKYLQLAAPGTGLLLAGVSGIDHPMYLDLLQPPASIEQLRPATAALDSLPALPRDPSVVDISQKLHRFFAGHGDESVTAALHKTLRILKIAADELTVHQTPYEEVFKDLLVPNKVAENWQVLRARLTNYRPFFGALPFFCTFDAVAEALGQLSPYFEGGCRDEQLFWSLHCIDTLVRINADLTSIESTYVK